MQYVSANAEVREGAPLITILVMASFGDRQKLAQLRDYLERCEPSYVESNMLVKLPEYDHGPHQVSFTYRLSQGASVARDPAQVDRCAQELFRTLESVMGSMQAPAIDN